MLVDQTLSLLEIYCARSKDVISSTIITLQKSASNVAPITKNRQAGTFYTSQFDECALIVARVLQMMKKKCGDTLVATRKVQLQIYLGVCVTSVARFIFASMTYMKPLESVNIHHGTLVTG